MCFNRKYLKRIYTPGILLLKRLVNTYGLIPYFGELNILTDIVGGETSECTGMVYTFFGVLRIGRSIPIQYA